ncbi:MAG: hypothetical protein O7G87_23525 [bacterium]|nr:hypothetical protein [bacterium]
MNTNYPAPNPEVLEAQSRICTGPHQSRPLGKKPDDPQPDRILHLILESLQGNLSPQETVSPIQMGAFFTAMTLRRNFPEKTNWSPAETSAFETFAADLNQHLPPELHFLLHPEQIYQAPNKPEQIARNALQTILNGQHLDYATTLALCQTILNTDLNPALKGAALIGQRMNLETYDEVKAYLDSVFPPDRVQTVNTPSLTHFGEPYNGSTRYFRPTLFIAAIRAAQGKPTVLHGTDLMPPKSGITEEQILQHLGAQTHLSLERAAHCLEHPDIGFAYLSQQTFSPGAYAARELRVHIAKRPPWSATEKAQRFFTCPGTNHMVIGYYHSGYEDKFLRIMEEYKLTSGIVVKGEEGTSHFSLRLGKPSDAERKAINYAQGFRQNGQGKTYFSQDVDPAAFGYTYNQNPRLPEITPQSFAEAGLAALSGQKGPVYDRLILNTALTDHLLGLEPDPDTALQLAQEAIVSGRALNRLQTYIRATNQK